MTKRVSKATRDKLSKANTGRPVSQSTRDKISQAMQGNKNSEGFSNRVYKKKKRYIDHQKIRDKFIEAYRKGEYNAAVANSAARMMFINASDEERLNTMRLVNEVRK